MCPTACDTTIPNVPHHLWDGLPSSTSAPEAGLPPLPPSRSSSLQLPLPWPDQLLLHALRLSRAFPETSRYLSPTNRSPDPQDFFRVYHSCILLLISAWSVLDAQANFVLSISGFPFGGPGFRPPPPEDENVQDDPKVCFSLLAQYIFHLIDVLQLQYYTSSRRWKIILSEMRWRLLIIYVQSQKQKFNGVNAWVLHFIHTNSCFNWCKPAISQCKYLHAVYICNIPNRIVDSKNKWIGEPDYCSPNIVWTEKNLSEAEPSPPLH